MSSVINVLFICIYRVCPVYNKQNYHQQPIWHIEIVFLFGWAFGKPTKINRK